MFDRAIIDTDKFMDLPMSTKAIYFLLGMEADDEGFVSYKKVIRIHGGNDDDVKVLTAKGFLIAFNSGVVVITDWNSNNYLNQSRIKPTEYQKERQQLLLTEQGKYEFNTCSTSIEESSIEENRIEENSIEESSVEKRRTPKEEADSFFKEEEPYQELLTAFSKDKDKVVIEREFKKFILYWTESNGSGTKQRWQQQSTFEVKKRLYTWLSRMDKFSGNIKKPSRLLL